MEISERIATFLRDLGMLSTIYGVKIMGCGCCGSPFLDVDKEDKERYDATAYEVDADMDNLRPK